MPNAAAAQSLADRLTAATFEACKAKIEAPDHAAAGGVTGGFTVVTGDQNWQLIGDLLPEGATTIASMVRSIPATVASLADADKMAAGTKESTKTTGSITSADLSLASLASAGNWTDDADVPGSPSGAFAVIGKGKLNVKTAAKYSFAAGIDDGTRLRIDLNKNGFGPEDNVIVEDASGGFRAKYADVTFAAAGDYDFEWVAFNTGGNFGAELSVTKAAGGGNTTAVDSGAWELLGASGASSPVTLKGAISLTTYVPSGAPDLQTIPLLVVLNGPDEGGTVFGGGPFTGFEGKGFFAGAALNKFTTPALGDIGGYRSVQLKSVNVAGKKNVKVTVAVAATFLDFETNDYLDIVAYPNGVGSAEVVLAHFSAPDGNTKYFVDTTHANTHRLGLKFQDVTYDIPATATDLVIEIRGATTFWNEIIGFDNIRITSGAIVTAPPTIAISRDGNKVSLLFTGSLVAAPAINGPWKPVTGATSPFAGDPAASGSQIFYRASAP